MSNARNLADIVTGNFDVPLGALDNVPPSNDASALTTGTLGTSRLPAGSVIQVVQSVLTTTLVIDSASYVSFLSASITPSSASSKILIVATVNGAMSANGSAFLSLFRGESQIAIGTDANGNTKVSFALDSGGTVGDAEVSGGLTWLDSPNTTSSISYSVRGNRGPASSARLSINRSNNYPASTTYDKNSVSSITLMEISA